MKPDMFVVAHHKIINKKVGIANSGKEILEITENNKSRKIKEFKSKAETALWLAESYGLLESTDGQTVKEERQKRFVIGNFQKLFSTIRGSNFFIYRFYIIYKATARIFQTVKLI
jgi:hypothetical protein